MAASGEVNEVGAGNLRESGINGHRSQRDAVPLENFLDIKAIDGTKRVELEDVGHQATVFYLRKPVDQDGELVVLIFFGDLLAGLFHVADPHAKPVPRSSESLSSVLHGMMLSQQDRRAGVSIRNHLGKMALPASNYSRGRVKKSRTKR